MKPIFYDEYFDNLNEQVIHKGKTKKNKYCIFSDVQENRNFGVDPYIKIYNALNQTSATAVARISMKTGAPLPTDHRNREKDGGKDRLRFTKDVAEFLTKAMMEKPNAYDYPDDIKTVYDAIYYDIDQRLSHEKWTKFPIPNFMENIE